MERIEVLLVDDHPLLAEGLEHALSREQDIVVVGMASTASQAIEAAAALAPDVLLVDYHLPDGDGAGVATAVLARAPETVVIVMTASHEDEVVARALGAGCAGVVTKDRPASAVVRAIRAALAGQPVVAADVLVRILQHRSGPDAGSPTALTDRECKVLHLLHDGLTTAQMADTLHLSTNTVRNYVQSLLEKLGAHTRVEALAAARRRGLV